jgi:hypothetical protein
MAIIEEMSLVLSNIILKQNQLRTIPVNFNLDWFVGLQMIYSKMVLIVITDIFSFNLHISTKKQKQKL